MKIHEIIATFMVLMAMMGVFIVFAQSSFRDAQREWAQANWAMLPVNLLLALVFFGLAVACFVGAETIISPLFLAAKPC